MSEAPIPSEWSRSWLVVLAASVSYGVSGGLFSLSAGLFLNPMRHEFGWTMSQVTFAPVVYLVIAFMMPAGGVVIDKLGGRVVAIFGVLLFAGAYAALATLPLSLTLLYSIVGCLGILGPSVNSGPYLRVVATWFRRHVGLAFGITTAGTSFAGVLLVPVIALAIEKFGWRGGYFTLAAIQIGIALPLLLWLFREKKGVSAITDVREADGSETLRTILTTGRFWLLVLALGLAALPIGVYLAHLQPILQSANFTVATGAMYGSLFAMAIGVGRIGGGLLVDRFWSFGIAAGAIAVAVFGCLIITSLTPASPVWLICLTIVSIGLSYGGEVDFGAYFSLKLFGLQNFAKVFGCASLVMGVSYAGGGMMASALFDVTSSYAAVGPITALCFALSSVTFLLLGWVHWRHQRLGAEAAPLVSQTA